MLIQISESKCEFALHLLLHHGVTRQRAQDQCSTTPLMAFKLNEQQSTFFTPGGQKED